MKLFAVLLLTLLVAGCAKNKPASELKTEDFIKSSKAASASAKSAATKTAAAKPAPTPSAKTENQPIVTPADESVGRVAMVNKSARFAVVTFPFGSVPGTGQRLSLYRDGLKVAELQVTGPQRDNNTVADVVAGEPQVDDEVRGN